MRFVVHDNLELVRFGLFAEDLHINGSEAAAPTVQLRAIVCISRSVIRSASIVCTCDMRVRGLAEGPARMLRRFGGPLSGFGHLRRARSDTTAKQRVCGTPQP